MIISSHGLKAKNLKVNMNCCVFRSLDPYKNLIDYHCKDTELLKISSMYCEKFNTIQL